MKTPLVIALSIVGVLGTAGAAMAVNAGTLASFQQSNLGNAPTTLIDPTSSPSPSLTAEPGDDNGTDDNGTDDATDHSSPSPEATHHDDDGTDDSHAGSDDATGGHDGSDDGSHGGDSGSGHGSDD